MSRIVTRYLVVVGFAVVTLPFAPSAAIAAHPRIAHSEKVVAVASTSWDAATPDGPPWG